jgi:hypothetical protein
VPSACDDVMGFSLFQRISLVEVAGPKQQALISLSDKRDVGFLAKGLVDLGYNRVFVSCVSLLFDVKLNAEVCLQSIVYSCCISCFKYPIHDVRRNFFDLNLIGNARTLLPRFKLISTGGTASTLQQAGFEVTPVEQLTSFPEMVRHATMHSFSMV